MAVCKELRNIVRDIEVSDLEFNTSLHNYLYDCVDSYEIKFVVENVPLECLLLHMYEFNSTLYYYIHKKYVKGKCYARRSETLRKAFNSIRNADVMGRIKFERLHDIVLMFKCNFGNTDYLYRNVRCDLICNEKESSEIVHMAICEVIGGTAPNLDILEDMLGIYCSLQFLCEKSLICFKYLISKYGHLIEL